MYLKKSCAGQEWETQFQGPLGGSTNRFTLNFDDLDASGVLPDGYGTSGLLWQNVSYLNKDYAAFLYGGNQQAGGYYSGVESGEDAIHSTDVDSPATFTTGGGNFNVAGLYLTSAFYNGLQIEIKGYDDGVLKYDVTETVDVTSPTHFDLHWHGVDTVSFSGSGGTLAPNVGGTTHDFVIDDLQLGARNGAVTGTVYNDANGNGVQDGGEAGLKGVTVFVDLNHNGILDDGEQSAVTNKNGVYKLGDVPFGAHDIVQETPAGYTQTSPFDSFPTYAVDDAARYKWADIAQTGTEVHFANGDDGASSVGFGHGGVHLFGETYKVGYVSTNGFITFGQDGDTSNQPQQLPTPDTPNAVIAPFWADLNPSASGGTAYFFDDSAHHRFIIEFQNFALYSDVSKVQTFEVIIDRSGAITFQYQHMDDHGSSASIGLENADGTAGVQYSFDQDSLHDQEAITFAPSVDQVPGAAHVSVDSGKTTSGVNFGDQLSSPQHLTFGQQAPQAVAEVMPHIADHHLFNMHLAIA